jgi:hypothetical protein
MRFARSAIFPILVNFVVLALLLRVESKLLRAAQTHPPGNA